MNKFQYPRWTLALIAEGLISLESVERATMSRLDENRRRLAEELMRAAEELGI